jgi:hypothetical protein
MEPYVGLACNVQRLVEKRTGIMGAATQHRYFRKPLQ